MYGGREGRGSSAAPERKYVGGQQVGWKEVCKLKGNFQRYNMKCVGRELEKEEEE